ncbi:hypothetical protein TL16_g08197 [Triparma laevis f. inornata]|uniref:Uncharacterized protein n=1 Tax=Triparma laevis f. inornata TaxID=1714386 RepID=A0A9W7EI76_9STRA|nr:hypothetical protein TL16_g08197 [Triparma laevis f. inornata]
MLAKAAPCSQLVIDLLEHTPSVQALRSCQTDAALQATIDEFRTTRADNEKAIADIVDKKARKKTQKLQQALFEATEDSLPTATKHFSLLKTYAAEQTIRLARSIKTAMNKYATTDPNRYAHVADIINFKSDIDQVTPKKYQSQSIERQVDALLLKAAWKEELFQTLVNDSVDVFNTATSIEKVCSKFEFDEEETTEFTKGDPEFRPQTFFLEDGSKSVTLKDLNRVSLEFEDPLALGLMYRVIQKVFKCTAVNNKFQQTTYTEPPDLHINAALPSFDPDSDPWIIEIQLLFRDILTVKKELHIFYGIVRAETPEEVLANPAFIGEVREKVEGDTAVRALRESAEKEKKDRDEEILALKQEVTELKKQQSKFRWPSKPYANLPKRRK